MANGGVHGFGTVVCLLETPREIKRWPEMASALKGLVVYSGGQMIPRTYTVFKRARCSKGGNSLLGELEET